MHTSRLSRAARVALLGLALSALGGLGLVALASAHDGPVPPGLAGGPPTAPPPGVLGLPSGGPALQRLLDEAGASPAQRVQIDKLLAPAREPATDQRAEDRADRERLAALFTAATVDAQAVEALRARMAGRHEAASQRLTAAVVAAANVLSPAQRRQLAAHWPPMGGPRHDRMGHHEGQPDPALPPPSGTPADAGAPPRVDSGTRQ
jgi:protein CpxP